MQNISHTIPAYVFNGSNLSKLLRITKNTLKSSNFSPKVKQLFLKIMNQRVNQATLLKQIEKVIKQHLIAF